ncbi:MAG TPA: peptidylprolyl isomerase [Solirubrobacteraceae bacterium]|nr:peptidylprolyl isomerase [Solirubrobacteraceae bacterium]
MLRLIGLLLCLGMLVAACGEDDDAAGETAATPTATEEAAPAGCEAAEAPEPRPEGDLPKPKAQLAAGKTYVATVSTNCGDFEITLDAQRAPKTGGSFKSLADEGFFDGTTFHRIVAGFVIQGGDPKGDGTGGPGYTVVEAPPDGLVYAKGVVAMAKAGNEPPGASGSQFFVVTAEDAQLPPDYALLGKVTSGQDVVDKIGVAETDAMDAPVEPVVISSVKVTES